jgi:hypothetical protein
MAAFFARLCDRWQAGRGGASGRLEAHTQQAYTSAPNVAPAMKLALYLVFVTALGLASLEEATRFLKPLPPLPSVHEIGWNAVNSLQHFTTTADRAFIADPAREANQLLLRGRPFTAVPAGKTRVLLVGNSQVEAAALPFADLPEIELERALNRDFGTDAFEVRSIAAGGWSQDQQYLALQRYYRDFRADYILLWHTPRNDYWENAFPDRSTNHCLGALKPTFVLTKDGLRPFDFSPYEIGTSLLSHSLLYRRIVRVLERWDICRESRLHLDWDKFIPGTEGHATVPRSRCPETVIDQFAFSRQRATLGDAPVSLTTPEAFLDSRSHLAPFLETMSRRDAYLIALTQALLADMAQTARSHHTQFIVFINGQTYRSVSSEYLPVGSCVVRSGNWYRLADMAERVRGAFSGLNFIELVARHPDLSIDDVTIAAYDRHLNQLGDRLVVNELVAQLKEKGLIKPKAPPPGGNG